MSTIRGTALQGFVELVQERDGDAPTLLRQANLAPTAIGDPDSYISFRSAIAVLEAAAASTHTPDFGLRLATRQGLEILGPVGVAARTSETVGGALRDIEQYTAVYSPALSLTVHAAAGDRLATFEWAYVAYRPPPHRQAAELALGAALRVYQLLIGADFRPTSVNLRHDPSPGVDYQQHFGCPVRFSQSMYGFRFPAATLRQPLSADSAVHDVVRSYLDTVALPEGTSPAQSVRALIKRMLPTGGPDLALIASHLAVHPRTLQRQLAAEATSFATLLDDVRRDEAAHCLRDTTISLGQISRMLGYSEQAVLTRSCRRWFGASPTAARRTGQA